MQTDSLWFAKKAHFRLIPSIENFDISLSKTRNREKMNYCCGAYS